MAVVMVEGFDVYNGIGANTGLAAKWGGGVANVGMATGRFGGQCVNCASAGSSSRSVSRTLASATTSIGVGVAMRFTTMPTADSVHAVIGFLKGATWTLGVRVNSLGGLEVYRMTSATAGTSLGTSANNIILSNTWHYIEVGATINDTTGSVLVKVDGTTVVNLTSQDTNNAVTNVDTINLGFPNVANLGTVQFDDLYVLDSSTTLGERRVETLYPTSDVAQGFTRSTGSTNYTLVDEAQVNGDTDYVQGSTVGDVDTYGFGDLSSSPTTIDAVQVNAFALKTDAGSRSIALQVKSGATTSDGSNFGLNASYAKLERLLLTDPNTSAAWTASAVNAIQGGPKVAV